MATRWATEGKATAPTGIVDIDVALKVGIPGVRSVNLNRVSPKRPDYLIIRYEMGKVDVKAVEMRGIGIKGSGHR